MKSSKINGLQKTVSFALIAVMLVFVIGFVSSGFQNPPDSPDDGSGDTNSPTDDNTPPGNEQPNEDDKQDESPDTNKGENNQEDSKDNENLNSGNQDQNPDDDFLPPVVEPEPTYFNKITGLEVSKEKSEAIPVGYVVDPSLPLYGISSSDITFEFPTEDGKTRMLSYTTDSALLWKIGSLSRTRAFISGISNFIGGVVVSYGNDDLVKYSIWDTSKIELDLSKHYNSYFLENTLYIYTSKELTDNAIEAAANLSPKPYKSCPFLFSQLGNVVGIGEAATVTLPYSEEGRVDLYYSEKTGRYLYYKAGARKMDMLTGKNVGFDNVFILFADTTTYEKAHGSELVIDIMGGGSGYYVSGGTYLELRWGINEIGELAFYSLNGEKLAVNPGTSYVAYYKSSQAASVKIGY